MLSSDSAKETDPDELSHPNDILVPVESESRPSLIHRAIILVVVNFTCLGFGNAFGFCIVATIFFYLVLLIPEISWAFKRRVTIFIFLGLLTTCPFQMCILPIIDPVRRPDSWQEASLLKLTPPGTPRAEVLALIKEKGWRPGGHSFRYVDEKEPAKPSLQEPIAVHLGRYWTFDIPTDVSAEWTFDEKGKVIKVEVTSWSLSL